MCETDERYRALFEHSLDGILLTAPDGAILAANPALCRMLGRTEEEICRLGRSGVVDTSDTRLATHLAERARTGQFTGEMFLLRADGTRVPAEVSSRVYTDHDGQLRTSMIARDVSERHRSDAALQISEERFRSAFEHAAFGMAMVSTNGDLLQVNQSLCRMFGYTGDELVQMTFQQLTHPDDLEVGLDLLRDLLTGRRDFGWLQKRYVHRDGHVIWAQLSTSVVRDAGGAPIYLVSQIQDISEQVSAQQFLEQRVAERTRELATLLEISHTIASTLELQPLLDIILDQLRVVIDYHSASLFTLRGDALVLAAYRGPRPPQQVTPAAFPVSDYGDVETLLGRTEPIACPHGPAEEPARGFRHLLCNLLAESPTGVHDVLWIPLVVKHRVIGGLGVTHSQDEHFSERHTALALTIANHAAIAIENATLLEEAREFAALNERQRLARELHDAVTQTLFSASLIAEVLPRLWLIDPQEGQTGLNDLRQLTRGALAEMRALLMELRPATLADADLGDLLRQLANAMSGRTNVPVTVDVRVPGLLAPEVKVALYRVAQEAVHNVTKHARASHVTLSLHTLPGPASATEPPGIELRIADDGRGFDPAAAYPDRFGLGIMRERTEQIGAELSIESRPGGGTRVTVVWRPRSADAASPGLQPNAADTQRTESLWRPEGVK